MNIEIRELSENRNCLLETEVTMNKNEFLFKVGITKQVLLSFWPSFISQVWAHGRKKKSQICVEFVENSTTFHIKFCGSSWILKSLTQPSDLAYMQQYNAIVHVSVRKMGQCLLFCRICYIFRVFKCVKSLQDSKNSPFLFSQ